MNPWGIAELDKVVANLAEDKRRLFHRIFRFSVVTGRLNPPETMRCWIEERFGSIEKVASQKIVKVTNMVTLEGALFNELRASRPIEVRESLGLQAQIINGSMIDQLKTPLQDTPEDPFGRVRGKYCITASNIAKYDSLHDIIVFDEYNPLQLAKEGVIDYIDTSLKWAERARAEDPEAKYYFFMWNCLWRSGASLFHGHAQVLLGYDIHYARIEHLRRAALSYQAQYGSNYFDDLYEAHQALGCGFEEDGVRILAYLTPVKEKEVMLISTSLDQSLKERVYEALAGYKERLGVTAFNLAVCMPPLAEVEESWEGFPVLVRIVDRGDPTSKASDIGAMELYASSVISSDPFEVARVLKDYMALRL